MDSVFNQQIRDIGILLAGSQNSGKRSAATDIERTLLSILNEAHEDQRLFALACSWIKVHGNYVITEKLAKLSKDMDRTSRLLLSALSAFAVENGIHKYKRLVKVPTNPTPLFDGKAYLSAINFKGPIGYLEKFNILAAEGSIRIREADILPAEDLVHTNRQYRNRYLYGSCWRADIITAIELGAKTPTEICNITGCSYEPAHRIFAEYTLASA